MNLRRLSRVALSVSLVVASSAFAEDYAVGFKRLFIKPIYDKTAKCQPAGGYTFFAPVQRPDGTYDPANPVVVKTEYIRSQVVTWYSAFFGIENEAKNGWNTFSPVCVGLYDDVVLSGEDKGQPDPNAFASDKRHIVVGTRMLERIAKGVYGGQEDSALLFILAHEFGHHIQYSMAQTYSDPTAKISELQADCLAGYILGSNEKTAFKEAVYQSVKDTPGKLGDFALLNPQHHGTPAERGAAFKEGWVLGQAGRITDFMDKKNNMPRAGASAALKACWKYPSDQQRAKK